MKESVRVVLWLVVCAPVSAAQIAFEYRVDLPVENQTFNHRVAVGDVDGDGDIDVLNGATTSQTWLNAGDGTFARPLDQGLGVMNDLRLADLDGDGVLDLVRAEQGGVWTYPGLGDGTFGSGIEVHGDTALNPIRTIEVGDLTGDGAPDIVTTSGEVLAGQMVVDLVVNNGDGTFAAPTLLQSPLGALFPVDVEIGDLNQDGAPDMILVANSIATSVVRTYMGTGAGTVAFSHQFGTGPEKVVDARLADLDGDAVLDLALGGSFGFATFSGDGDGTFAPVHLWSTRVFHDRIVVADVDGDGHDDVAFTSLTTWELVVLRGDGAGAFVESYAMTTVSSARDTVAADLDGDTRPDLVFASIDGSGQHELTTVRNHTYFATEPWVDLGQGLADQDDVTPEQPMLWADGTLLPGEPLSLSIARNGAPQFSAWLILGLSELSLPFKGGTMVPSFDVLVGPTVVPGSFVVELGGTMPAGFPSGSQIWMQAWLSTTGGIKTWSATSAVRATVP